jgi:hypothetical protein
VAIPQLRESLLTDEGEIRLEDGIFGQNDVEGRVKALSEVILVNVGIDQRPQFGDRTLMSGVGARDYQQLAVNQFVALFVLQRHVLGDGPLSLAG